MQELLPRYFKAPQFEIYDETVDLVSYLETFRVVMLLYGAVYDDTLDVASGWDVDASIGRC